MINLLTLVLMLLAVVRLTRLVVYDKITQPIRSAFVWLADRKPKRRILKALVFVADKITYLVHCEWCTGFWVSVAVVTPWAIWPDTRGLCIAYAILAIAEIAPRILTWEPRSR